MPARRKKTKTPAKQKVPDYPLLTLGEYEALSPQEKMRFLEFLRANGQPQGDTGIDKLWRKAPDLIKQGIETYSEHFGSRARLTTTSMWAHIGVLAFCTTAIVLLGIEAIIDGATVVALLGPLYTYVLVNLRYLTGWSVVGDSTTAR